MRFAALLALGLAWWSCGGRASMPARPPALASAAPVAPATPAPDAFAQNVAPLLARTCTPCHVPGGKMYERLPFDDPATVRGVKEGVLRRLTDPEERSVVEGWLAGQPPE